MAVRLASLCLLSSLLLGLMPAAAAPATAPQHNIQVRTTHKVFSLQRYTVYRKKATTLLRNWRILCGNHDGGGGGGSNNNGDGSGGETKHAATSKHGGPKYGMASDSSSRSSSGGGNAVPADNQVEYMTEVVADGNRYQMILDTGSSDSFFAKSGFVCVDSHNKQVAAQECKFGPAFKGTMSGGTIPNVHFNIAYGSAPGGPSLSGIYGYME